MDKLPTELSVYIYELAHQMAFSDVIKQIKNLQWEFFNHPTRKTYNGKTWMYMYFKTDKFSHKMRILRAEKDYITMAWVRENSNRTFTY